MITINARKLSDDELKILWIGFLDIVCKLGGEDGNPDPHYKTLYNDVKPTLDFLSKELAYRMCTVNSKPTKE